MASVRKLLVALGIGLLVQRAAQLVALLALARTLGASATGIHAQGVAFGGLLAVLATAGLRNPVARALAREPGAARPWLAAAIRVRLERGLLLAAGTATVAFACTSMPWFWTLCALQVVPAAFDLKHLGDAVSRTRREVALETTASVSFAALVLAWLGGGGSDLTTLAAVHLACRLLYAIGAAGTVASLPSDGTAPDLVQLRRDGRRLMPAQVAGDLCVAADVWIVARIAGDGTAGLYAVAARIAGAAGMPTAQLSRLFFAHQLHAARGGDPARTVRVALRAQALVLLPMAAGGAVVAGGLCRLFGPEFEQAAGALRWLLVAVAAQHLGWQGHQSLLATGRDGAYARALWAQAAVHLFGLALLTPLLGATGAAVGAALAQLAFATRTLMPLGRAVWRPLDWLLAPCSIAATTAAAALAAGLLVDAFGGWLGSQWTSDTLIGNGPPESAAAWHGAARLGAALLCGALAWFTGLHTCELQKRWGRIGSGLTEASGLR